MASTHFATSRRMGIHDPLQQIRPGGPPKLRITGIELPQRGSRQFIEWFACESLLESAVDLDRRVFPGS